MGDKVFDFGVRLKELRGRANLTQDAVAKRLDITVGTYKKYESNTLSPPIEKLETLAVLFRTSLDYMRNLDDRTCIYLDSLPVSHQEFIVSMVEHMETELPKLERK